MDPSKHRGLSLAFPGYTSRLFPQQLPATMHSPVALTGIGQGRAETGWTDRAEAAVDDSCPVSAPCGHRQAFAFKDG